MRKLLMPSILSLLCLLFAISPISAYTEAEIAIIIHDQSQLETDRSLIPTVEATFHLDMQSVEVVFNETVGTVSIAIVNEIGQTVGVASCNTSFEGVKYVPVPTDAGDYTIYINGVDYEGDGSYTIADDFCF